MPFSPMAKKKKEEKKTWMHDGNEHMWLILYSLLFNGLHHSVQHLVQWNTLETLSFKIKFYYFIPIFQWAAPFCATLNAVEQLLRHSFKMKFYFIPFS